MSLEELRARLKGLNDELQSLLETETKDMSGDESGEHFDTIKAKTAEVEKTEGQIETLESAEAARGRAAKPANDPINDDRLPAQVRTEPLDAVTKVGLMVAAMGRAQMEEGARGARAVMRYLEEAGYGDVAKEFAPAQRALNSGTASGGGVLVPEDMSGEIIDILRNNTTFLNSNPRRVPMPNGNYVMPAAASGATAAWRGEGKAATVSQPTFKDINMSVKFLDTLVPLTSQLVRFSRPDVQSWVRMDMGESMGIEIDRAAYLGSGTQYEPLGITKIDGVSRIAATDSVSPTVAQIESDAASAELVMMNANLPMSSAKWVFSPRTFIFLQNLRDGNGNRYYPELQLAQPRWRNKPVEVTTQVPVTGGDGTNESEIFLVAFDHVFFGEGSGMRFAVSDEATYVKNGTTVSAFQNDLVLVKASLEADVDVRYFEAVVVLTGVKWGA